MLSLFGTLPKLNLKVDGLLELLLPNGLSGILDEVELDEVELDEVELDEVDVFLISSSSTVFRFFYRLVTFIIFYKIYSIFLQKNISFSINIQYQ